MLNRLFGLFRAYTDGFLPYAGALANQPHNLVEAFNEISLVKGMLDAEDAEDANSGGNSSEDGQFKSILKGRGKN